MILKTFLLFALLFVPPMALAVDQVPTCNELLEMKAFETDLERMKEQFQKIDQGLELAANRENLPPIQPDDLKAFKSPSKLMTILKKLPQHNVNPVLISWWALEHQIFKDSTHATPEIVLEFGLPSFNRFEALFANAGDFSTLYKEAHQGQNSGQTKPCFHTEKIKFGCI